MNTYSIKITPLQASKIKDIMGQYKCEFDTIQHSIWRAKTSAFQATYYASGKFLLQGKEVSDIANKINKELGIEQIQDNIKQQERTPVHDKYIGTDESGKGDFFGALVIAGVQITKANKKLFIDLGIKDSKRLDDKKIKQLANTIKANSVHSVIVITPQKYNELYEKFNNLNKLLAWGHARAIENILVKSPCDYAIADKFGDESLIKNALMQKGRGIILNQMVRAEADTAVAAASILARAEFVKRTDEMSEKYELEFSKGASDKVVNQAKIFVEKYGYARLCEVAKMHFKTAKELF